MNKTNPSATETANPTLTTSSTVTLSHEDFEQLLMVRGDTVMPSASLATAGTSVCDPICKSH